MDPADLRAAIPATDQVAYLNTGAGGPSPRSVVDACTEAVEYHATEAPVTEGAYPAMHAAGEAARERIAEHVGAESAATVALTDSTADGLATVAAALALSAGDTVVRTDLEHPAGVLPWRRLADTVGIEVRVVECEDGRLPMDRLERAVSGADCLLMSSITWSHGTRLPVIDAVEVAHDAGALAVVDAVQSVGQRAVDVQEWGADVVVGAGHKWLLGPWGAGFLYVAPDAIDRLSPRVVGYDGVVDPDSVAESGTYELAAGARRFDVGSRSPVPAAGIAAAIDTIEAVGFDAIEGRIERLTERLKERVVADLGPERLLSPRAFESGLVTFESRDSDWLVARLNDAGVIVRPLPFPEGAVRASVHAFNTSREIDRLCDLIEEFE
jgi:selenocysteine lyase/cysteine desulfurase